MGGNEDLLCSIWLCIYSRGCNFVVEITSDAGTAIVTVPRYTSAVSGFRDDEVPLRPQSSCKRVLGISLNDLGATPGAGWTPMPGEYGVRVLYDSDRSSREASKWIWRGRAASNPSTVWIKPPEPGALTDHKQQLSACVGNGACDTLRLANFYSVVRDNAAADLLVRLLSDRLYDIWLLDAIVFQSRASDAEQLRELASRVSDLTIRQQFLNAAGKLDGSVRRQSASRTRAGKD